MEPGSGGQASFADLYEMEIEQIAHARRAVHLDPPASGTDRKVTEGWKNEPLAPERHADLVGLCLSGGGIRSATFNLGLLQGLDRLGVLHVFDYMSTVSGGGYIGGWWTSWLARKRWMAPDAAPVFPEAENGGPEARAVRHLREFSRFLAPRWGFLEVETGNFVMTAVAAAIPTFIATIAVSILLFACWLLPIAMILAAPRNGAALLLFATILCLLIVIAASMRDRDTAEPFRPLEGGHGDINRQGSYSLRRRLAVYRQDGLPRIDVARIRHPAWWLSLIATATVAVVWWALAPIGPDGRPDGLTWLERTASVVDVVRVAAPAVSAGRLPVNLVLLHAPLLAVAAGAGSIIVLRVLASRYIGSNRTVRFQIASDRLLGRLLWIAGIHAFFSVTWHAGAAILAYQQEIQTAVTAAVTGAATAWLTKRFSPTPSSGQRASRSGIAGLFAIRMLARISTLLFFALVAVLLQTAMRWGASPIAVLAVLAVAAFCIVSVFAFLIDPTVVSLHAFYRSRIARAFLGASAPLRADGPNANTARYDPNRFTDERVIDDLELFEDVGGWTMTPGTPGSPARWSPPSGGRPLRPLHLISLAANDLAGDPLGTLNRGARSAVLSGNGFAMGDRWISPARMRPVRLGSALTASAAAVNPNMGNRSKDYGRVVAFLLCALNLRLGLWIRTDTKKRGTIAAFFREMFGFTIAGPESVSVHLSDGGHFENLGLYELVRRRCVYILASDCGADPDVRFEDLGNAIRRVREDFGVEIDINLGPLRLADDGISPLHVAVGRIQYPGGVQGILLVVKPTLTGDEPEDVRQYHQANRAFPHESTGDQFYDEAQWESYRRLGEHTAIELFSFVRNENDWRAARIFSTAALEWSPPPADIEANMLSLTSRFTDFVRTLAVRPTTPFAREFLAPLSGGDGDDEERILTVLHVLQLMEDVWHGAKLDRNWAHTINSGWMDLFDLWVNTPTFQRFWPVLKRCFGLGFIDFMQARFPDLKKHATDRTCHEPDEIEPWMLAALEPRAEADRMSMPFRRRLDVGTSDAPRWIDIASIQPPHTVSDGVEWHERDIRVSSGLRSSRMGSRLLQVVIGRLRASRDTRLRNLTVRLRIEALAGENEHDARRSIFRRSLAYTEISGGVLVWSEAAGTMESGEHVTGTIVWRSTGANG